MRILQVNTFDVGGGAEKIALSLHHAYSRLGHSARLAVGRKISEGEGIIEIPRSGKWRAHCLVWQNRFLRAGQKHKSATGLRLSRLMMILADPVAATRGAMGQENFFSPSTRRLLSLLPEKPDVLHLHNLHGGYFDLTQLPRLSHEVPLALTLHDAWLLSGHCVHSFECERWVTGCGRCPHLDIYWPIRRDASAFNWRRKKRIYSRCLLNVATPSKWLMDKVQRSILAPGILDCRVIPNGVDVSVFRPGDKQAARARLGIPADASVIMSAANGLSQNPWKDYRMLRAAIELVGNAIGGGLLFIGLGGEESGETLGRAELRFVPYQGDAATVASFYQAADLYIHAARVDTFPNTVLEALACGTPVVATAVGGIPEQIKALTPRGGKFIPGTAVAAGEATGVLVPPGEAAYMAEAITYLLQAEDVRMAMGRNAALDVKARFSLDRQVEKYLEWYQEILGRGKRRSVEAGVLTG